MFNMHQCSAVEYRVEENETFLSMQTIDATLAKEGSRRIDLQRKQNKSPFIIFFVCSLSPTNITQHMASASLDFYEVLEITRDASDQEIKKAYEMK